MITYKNLKILGTSHIARQSLDQVKHVMETYRPDIVAIELDKKRLFTLIAGKPRKLGISDLWKLGIKAFLFNLIGAYVEKKLGKMVGVKPGDEMKLAFNLAKNNKAKIALIDQKIEITLKKLSKAISWKEKFQFVWDIIAGAFKVLILRKHELMFDLTKVPAEDLVKKMIDKVRKDYPNVYKVLIEERNQIMGKRLARLIMLYPDKKIFAVIGAGHEKEIVNIIQRGGFSSRNL